MEYSRCSTSRDKKAHCLLARPRVVARSSPSLPGVVSPSVRLGVQNMSLKKIEEITRSCYQLSTLLNQTEPELKRYMADPIPRKTHVGIDF